MQVRLLCEIVPINITYQVCKALLFRWKGKQDSCSEHNFLLTHLILYQNALSFSISHLITSLVKELLRSLISRSSRSFCSTHTDFKITDPTRGVDSTLSLTLVFDVLHQK